LANTSVYGIYKTREQVEAAVDRFRREGFRNTDISVLFPDNQGSKDFAHEKNTKAPEGAAAGGRYGCSDRRSLGLAGRDWLIGNSGRRPVDRRRSHHGGACGCRRGAERSVR